jgi:hypothetical protein
MVDIIMADNRPPPPSLGLTCVRRLRLSLPPSSSFSPDHRWPLAAAAVVRFKAASSPSGRRRLLPETFVRAMASQTAAVFMLTESAASFSAATADSDGGPTQSQAGGLDSSVFLE